MFTLANTVLLLTQYKYLILFPIAIIEGPIATLIAGFLVTTGVFDLFVVYAIVVLGDMLGDSAAYMLGRGGGALIQKIFKKYINGEKVTQAREYFATHHNRALVLSKVMHGIGISGLLAAGSLKVPYRKFFSICAFVSTVQSAILLAIGILFGHAYLQLEKYLNEFSGVVAIVVAISLTIFLIKKYKIQLR